MSLTLHIHREGWRFIALAVGLNAVGFAVAYWLGIVLLPISVWVIAFFRDPERTAPPGANLVLSPADGKLLPIVKAVPPEELELGSDPRVRLAIFMSVFNVHVNRVPCGGTVTGLAYRPGKFFNASFDKASHYNERMSIRIRMDDIAGTADLAVVQIAGLVARRIVCDLQQGQKLCRGDRFGIIRFGSRLEVYLPDGARVLAKEGQTVVAGETVLADFPN
ncbi:MAG: phosphatidylserine decarboxylase [Rhizomicrobium sp.]